MRAVILMFCFVAAVGVASAAEGIDDDSVVQFAAAVGEAETGGAAADWTAAESPVQTAEKYILDKSRLTEGLSMDAPHLRSVVVRDTPNFGQRLLGKEALDEAIKAKIKKENYTFWKEQTYVGLPLIAAGLLLRSDKTLFRQNDPKTNKFRNTLLYDFKTGIDDYLQFLPLATTVVMNLAGVEGRSNFPRLLASGAFSYATMALFVNTLKYTVKEVRPDGSSANSWPSGHTATVFTAATILHKEYGLTRSPWYSVGGYAVATATGIMRVMNNRHWISDIISGAGFGILATELGYGIANLIWKDKGIRRPNLEAEQTVIEHPTFFSLGMGASFGNKSLDFANADNGVASLTLRTGTAVQVEGAYFFNKYIGVGGRLRVRSNPIGSWDVMDSYMKEMFGDMTKELDIPSKILQTTSANTVVVSDHLSEFSGGIGPYLNLPLSRHFALGAKVLVARNIIDNMDIAFQSTGEYKVDDIDLEGAFVLKEDKFEINESVLNVTANNGWSIGAGISMTYAVKNNFSWRMFVDYDYCKRDYSIHFDANPYVNTMFSRKYREKYGMNEEDYRDDGYVTKKLNNFVLGGSFVVSL